MDKPMFLISVPSAGIDRTSWINLLRIYTDRYEKLSSEGLDVKYLVADRRYWGENWANTGKYLENLLPRNSVIDLRADEKSNVTKPDDLYFRTLSWVRDLFQVVGKKAYTAKATYNYACDAIEKLNLELEVIEDDFVLSEGGFSVPDLNSKAILMSDFGPNCEEDKEELESTVQNGKTIYFVPVFMNKNNSTLTKKRLSDITAENGHIDTQINLLTNSNGDRLLCVNPDYQDCFPKSVDFLKNELKAKIYRVKEKNELEGCAVNFPSLGNGKIAISDDFNEIGSVLENHLGKENVVYLETLLGECTPRGGLRCRTNLVDSHPVYNCALG